MTNFIESKDLKSRLDFSIIYQRELGINITSKKSNGWEKANCLCPFHSDNHPGSLQVNLKNGGFICFACGEKGSIFDFIMLKYHFDFKDAVKYLMKEYL